MVKESAMDSAKELAKDSTKELAKGLTKESDLIEQFLVHPEKMEAGAIIQLNEMIAQYPYCATFRMLLVMALGNVRSSIMQSELKKTAVYIPDRNKLFMLLNHGEHEWADLQACIEVNRKNKVQEKSDDFLLIDYFLEQQNLPLTDATMYDATDALNRLQDCPILEEQESDTYSSLTDDEENANGTNRADDVDDQQSELIDNFIEAEKKGTLFVPSSESLPEEENTDFVPTKIHENAFLTESLAKIYIKQHKYEQALAIIRDLNLKYPKKNAYFADQIRYLEKIIAYKQNKITK